MKKESEMAGALEASSLTGSPWPKTPVMIITAGVLCYAAVLPMPTALVKSLAVEHGALEVATVGLLVLAAVLSALAAQRGLWQSGYLAAIIFAAGAAREFDFHDRFTSRGITRGMGIGFLSSAAVPWVEKLLVVLIVGTLTVVVARFLRREWAGLGGRLRARSSPVMHAVVGLALLGVAKVFDASYGWVKGLGLTISSRWQLLEELVELQAATLFVLALVPTLRACRQICPGARRRRQCGDPGGGTDERTDGIFRSLPGPLV